MGAVLGRLAAGAAAWVFGFHAAAAPPAVGSPPPEKPATEAPEAAGPSPASAEVWAGHQVVLGARAVPILGTLETRTDSYYLAQVERVEGEIRISQITCKMDIARFAGVKVSFLPDGPPKMPASRFVFRKGGDRWEAGPWLTRWEEEDVDQDGKPGATVQVEAPVCGGTVYLAGFSRAIARAKERDGGLLGEVRAQVGHRILGTSKGCISLVAKDSEEKVVGAFAYVPVQQASTCESLLAAGWPVQAPEAEEKSPAQRINKERKRIRR